MKIENTQNMYGISGHIFQNFELEDFFFFLGGATSMRCYVGCNYNDKKADLPRKIVKIYNPKTGWFSDGPELRTKRMDFGCALMNSPITPGKKAVLVAGGYSTNKVELLDYEVDPNNWIESKYKMVC